jgi:hypothetical protein
VNEKASEAPECDNETAQGTKPQDICTEEAQDSKEEETGQMANSEPEPEVPNEEKPIVEKKND